ncbi:MAG: acyl-coenzyme A synthetase/AMP-(fatty) acid ligase [bacterium]
MNTQESFNLTQFCLADRVQQTPNKTALIFVTEHHEEKWSFQRFYTETLKLANGLKQCNLPPQSRALIALPSDPNYLITFFASIAAGLVPIPCSPQLTEQEIEFLLKDSGAEFIFCVDKNNFDEHSNHHRRTDLIFLDLEDLENLQEKSDPLEHFDTTQNDPAFLIYTSGTTSYPKGVLHAQRTILGRLPMKESWTGLTSDDVLLHAGQLNWTYTLGVGLMDTWVAGGTSILYDGNRVPTLWPQLIEKYQATIFVAVPSLYRQILKYNELTSYDLSSLKYGLAAGEPLQPSILDEWRETVGTDLYEALGMSELSTYISSGSNIPILKGSPGKVQKGRRIAILPIEKGDDNPLPVNKVGLLAIHTSDLGLMLGYWNRPEEEKEVFRGEWFVGGDLASIDENGYVWFQGRNNDVMNSFGYRVSPLEIERVLLQHSDISNVAVTEVPVQNSKQIITAFIIVKEGSQLTKDQVLDWAKERMAHYKCPKDLRFVTDFPHTKNGKLLRRQLVKQY